MIRNQNSSIIIFFRNISMKNHSCNPQPFRDLTNVSASSKQPHQSINTFKQLSKEVQVNKKQKTSTLGIFETARIHAQKPQKQSVHPTQHNLKDQQTQSKGFRKKVNSCLRSENFKIEGSAEFDNGRSRDSNKIEKNECGQRKKDNPSIDIKGNPSKSFMIRKKNASTYCKKLQETKKQSNMQFWNFQKIQQPSPFFLEIENDHNKSNTPPQKVLRPIKQQPSEFNHRPLLEQECSIQHPKRIINQPINFQKEQHHLNSTIGIKVKPVMCKDTKRNNKQFQEEEKYKQNINHQKQRVNTQNSAKYLQIMIKKIRRISKLQPTNCKNANPKCKQVQKQPKLQYSQKESKEKDISLQNNKNKMIILPPCKTIKIPWGELSGYPNQDQGKKMREQLMLKDKEMQMYVGESFGPISVINNGRGFGREAAIQSLRELYEQLGFNLQSGDAESKMLLE